jgi:tetratricopeptide (TPR) repeat protein
VGNPNDLSEICPNSEYSAEEIEILFGTIRYSETLRRLGKFDAAIELFKSSLEAFPDNAWICNALGNAFHESGMHEHALNAWRVAHDILPEWDEAKYMLDAGRRRAGWVSGIDDIQKIQSSKLYCDWLTDNKAVIADCLEKHGVVFIHNLFPRSAIELLRQNFESNLGNFSDLFATGTRPVQTDMPPYLICEHTEKIRTEFDSALSEGRYSFDANGDDFDFEYCEELFAASGLLRVVNEILPGVP